MPVKANSRTAKTAYNKKNEDKYDKVILPGESSDEDDDEEYVEDDSSDEEDAADSSDEEEDLSSVESDQEFKLKEVSEDEDEEEEIEDDQEEVLPNEETKPDDEQQTTTKGDAVVNEVVPKGKSSSVAVVDEYEVDSSDEEDLRNTIGNIPVHWYDNFDHIGYDTLGRKILKPKAGKEAEVEDFLQRMDDPYYFRTVRDKSTGERVILTDADAEIVSRVKKGLYPNASFDPYPDFIDFFTYEKMIHPVTNRPEHTASFIPSIGEKRIISKLVAKIKRKWQNPKLDTASKSKKESELLYSFDNDIWEKEPDKESKRQEARRNKYIPAPKLQLPGHRESYNPPPEYCASKEEIERWKGKDPSKRAFLSQQFANLRSVPAYAPFVKERFERCLDLYLCPRVRKMKANVNPEDLIPKLPRPKELQPFPSQLAIVYHGHKDIVRSISIEPKGQFVASASDDKTVRIWEILTGRCIKMCTFEDEVTFVSWCPLTTRNLVAAVVKSTVYLINPDIGDKTVSNDTDELIVTTGQSAEPKNTPASEWRDIEKESDDWKLGHRVSICHKFPIRHFSWHSKGDYFSVVMPSGANKSVVIHQLTKRRSQVPFSKSSGIIQVVLFHPTRPYLVVATERAVRIYNLMKQQLSKKLQANCKLISSVAIHPGGDNIIVGSFDSRLPWFDLDLSSKPYKIMRYHKRGIRSVDFSPKYPLFASASDDGSVIVSHGMVFSDLLQNALIVPVKVLRGHVPVDGIGATDCKFHPFQPWILSAGADKTIRLYT